MKIDDMIAVLQAHKEGKPLQFQARDELNKWDDCTASPIFNFSSYNYRVKPEPREFWLAYHDRDCNGLHGVYRDKEAVERWQSLVPGERFLIHVREVLAD